MVLSINSPIYFSKEYGIDDDVYWMGRNLSRYIETKTYSKKIHTIGIVPIIAPEELKSNGELKDTIIGMPSCGVVTVYLSTDFKSYLDADIEGRKTLIIDNVLRSVKRIAKRYGIDYSAFEADLAEFCQENGIQML
jgi:hypothetical protein